jgi:FKBP-type peptidyl-prolyl cis-trans isomerase SlyD
MQIAKNAVVSIDYRLTDPAGKVLDESPEGKPLVYLHGAGNIIPGLEAALEGKAAGESVEVTVEPERAYGRRDDRLVHSVERTAFGNIKRIEHGMQFRTQIGGQPRVLTVVGFEKDGRVKVDANHPLAGETLRFQVTIVDVREATQEELAHGHVHGPGGHHH